MCRDTELEQIATSRPADLREGVGSALHSLMRYHGRALVITASMLADVEKMVAADIALVTEDILKGRAQNVWHPTAVARAGTIVTGGSE